MKKFFIVLGTLFFVTISAQQMKLSNEVVNFGSVEKGKEAKMAITITNTGDRPLIITQVKPSCGCTIPTWPKKPIMPGKSEKMTIEYDSSKVGVINKVIEIFSNDQKTARKVMKVKGEII